MRQTFILDKEWRFKLGDERVTMKSHGDSYNSSKAGQTFGVPNPDFDDSAWRVLDIPHDYLTESEFGAENLHSHGYKGRDNAWYRKSFKLPEKCAGKHLMLSFEGMAVTAEVYLNGSLMGRSFSAYAPLDIDITDRAFFGDRVNTLAVKIDGLTTEGWWYEGAGIYRHVKLYVKELLHLAHDSIFLKPSLDETTANDWDVYCEATVENSAYENGTAYIKTEIFDGDTLIASGISEPVTAAGDSRVKVSHMLRVNNPARWDVIDPKLYTAKISLISGDTVIDAEETRIGFRTFSVDKDHGFFLNGRPIKLMGTCNHQDHAGVGVAVPDSIQYYRIRRLKEMGTNAYRCSHNMPTKAVLDACDEYGLLVMDENRRFEARPEVIGHVEAMVKRDRNHPSVVMYSLFNEEPMQGTHEGGNIFRRMKAAVLRLDDSRLITGAMNGGYNDACGAANFMDVTGINYALPDGILGYRKLYPDQPIVGSENNSAVTTRGCYKTDMDANVLACYDEETVPWGQYIKDTWRFTRENEWFGGIFIWTGFDYRGEPTPFKWPSCSSQFGIMDTCGFAKDSFWQNKACFDPAPMIHITPHWNWKEGDTVRVMPATNCEEVELILNGKSLGRKPSDCCALASWEVPFEPGTITAIGYNGGVELVRAECVTAGKPVKIVIEPDRPYLMNDGMDAIVINLSVQDADGNTVETASDKLYFTLEGDGVLLGVGNGDPNCHESDHLPERSLFAGHAQAIVQTLPGAKTLKFAASADGLESAEIALEIRDAEMPAYIYTSAGRTVNGVTVTSKTYTEMPDATMTIGDDDMNSLEPVWFDPRFILPGFGEGYKFFRAFINVPTSANPAADGKCTLTVKRLCAAEVWVYIDGAEAAHDTHGDGAYSARFDAAAGVHELRLLVKGDGKLPCGIQGGMEISVG